MRAETKAAARVGWGEVTLRSLPAAAFVAASVFLMNNPGPLSLLLQIAAGAATLAAWIPFGHKQEA